MRGRLLPARVTYLEMVQPVLESTPEPNEGEEVEMSIVQVKNCPVHFYRYFYDRIGEKHHWVHRRKLQDATLSAVLQSPETCLYLLYLDGCPAGFCEMNLGNWPDLEIVYFGLMAEFQNRGWGRFFLSAMVVEGWRKKPERITIQTNTLDSPHALTLYQQLGFYPTHSRDVMMEAVPQGGGKMVS